VSAPTIYESIINERGRTITALRGRITTIRAHGPRLAAVAAAMQQGAKFDTGSAAQAIIALLREIERDIP
jgi:hypothetical protein